MHRRCLFLVLLISTALGLSACTNDATSEMVTIEFSTCLEQTYVVQLGAPYDACRATDDLPNPRE